MRLENIGPSGVWNSFKDDWLISPQAARLFFACARLDSGGSRNGGPRKNDALDENPFDHFRHDWDAGTSFPLDRHVEVLRMSR